MELIEKYKTIYSAANGLFKDRGSRFICKAFPVKSHDEIKLNLQNLRKEYYDARHHCYAFRFGYKKEDYRWNDDGEPSGTAGKPIYGQILSYDLTDILIVVIRYFGGVLLGTGGLINAYREATIDALNNSKIIELNVEMHYQITYSYEIMNQVMKLLKDNKSNIINTDFSAECKICFSIAVATSKKLEEALIKAGVSELNLLKTL